MSVNHIFWTLADGSLFCLFLHNDSDLEMFGSECFTWYKFAMPLIKLKF